MEMLGAKRDRMIASCSEFSHLVLYRLYTQTRIFNFLKNFIAKILV